MRTIRTLSFLGVIGAMLVPLAPAPASAQSGTHQTPVAPAFSACPDPASDPDEVSTPCLAILSFQSGVNTASRLSIVRGSGALVRFNLRSVNAVSVFVPNEFAYWSLALDPNVTQMIPDRPIHAFAKPAQCDPWPECKNGDGGSGTEPTGETVPAGVLRIGANMVLATGLGIGVAIVDTGLDSDHGDLVNQIAGGVTCLGDESSATCVNNGGEDDNGHGTHVGGTVAAEANGADVVGVAPEATLYSVKVLDAAGDGWDSNVIAGLEWIASHWSTSVDVVNMSLGRDGSCLDPVNDPTAALVRAAIQNLTASGISVVVAAGNDRNAEVSNMVPSGCPEVIAVASTTAEDGTNKCKVLSGDILADTASHFTTDGAMDANGVGVTISAPGETREDNTCGVIQSQGIESLAMGGGTTTKYGTSMAAPHVTGVVALMLDNDSSLCPEAIRDILRSTAAGQGSAPLDHPYIDESFDGESEGIVDAPAALGDSSSVSCSP